MFLWEPLRGGRGPGWGGISPSHLSVVRGRRLTVERFLSRVPAGWGQSCRSAPRGPEQPVSPGHEPHQEKYYKERERGCGFFFHFFLHPFYCCFFFVHLIQKGGVKSLTPASAGAAGCTWVSRRIPRSGGSGATRRGQFPAGDIERSRSARRDRWVMLSCCRAQRIHINFSFAGRVLEQHRWAMAPLVTAGPCWCPAALHLIYEWTGRTREPSARAGRAGGCSSGGWGEGRVRVRLNPFNTCPLTPR